MEYQDVVTCEQNWPAPLPDPKGLYSKYIDLVKRNAHNLVCAVCGILEHKLDDFTRMATDDATLMCLAVNPNLVPYDFSSGVAALNSKHIMIEPEGINVAADESLSPTLTVCHSCY